MKLITTLAVCTQALDLSALLMMQQANQGMTNPLLMMKMLDGDLKPELLPLLMGSGSNLQSMMPLLLMSDKLGKKTETSDGKVSFKSETEYQAVCDKKADISDKMACVRNVFNIYTCSQANAVSITDLNNAFDDFNKKLNSYNKATDCKLLCVSSPTTDAQKQACSEAEKAHKELFPDETSADSALKALFNDDMLMMMLMSGQNSFGSTNPALMLQLLS